METICKRCLLKDMGDQEYYQSVKDYIERLPEEMKAEPSLYQLRLKRCQACTLLVNGMCRLCGCFVEVRAAKAINHCAQSDEVW